MLFWLMAYLRNLINFNFEKHFFCQNLTLLVSVPLSGDELAETYPRLAPKHTVQGYSRSESLTTDVNLTDSGIKPPHQRQKTKKSAIYFLEHAL